MDDKIKITGKNNTWELKSLPKGTKSNWSKIGVQDNAKWEVERYWAWLVTKGYKLNKVSTLWITNQQLHCQKIYFSMIKVNT